MIVLNQRLFITNLGDNGLRNKKAGRFINRLGQATTELAVFGTIILVVFGVLLRYAQMYNAQQEVQMYAFRKSLELAKKRYNDGKYGSVTLVAMKEYLPVNLFSSEPQLTYATGSSSVTVDTDQGFYENQYDSYSEAVNELNNNPNTIRENRPATYYQIGNQMIANNTLIEAPYMLVKRKNDPNKGPKNPLISVVDWLNKIRNKDENKDYYSFETVPFDETKQIINGTYLAQERKTTSYVPTIRSDYTETSSKQKQVVTEYEIQSVNRIRKSDHLIKEVHFVPPDMVVEQNQTIEKEREYFAWD